MKMQDHKILRKNKNMVERVMQDETILLPVYKTSVDINCIYNLNKDASKVWELINGKRTIGAIKKKISREFDIKPEDTDRETSALIRDLIKIKAVR
jgi:hypothetical protein